MDGREEAIGYLNRKAYGRAQSLLEEWVRMNPEDLQAYMELISCLRERQRPLRELSEDFDPYVFEQSHWASIRRFLRAQQLFDNRREEDAAREYRELLTMGLDTPVIRFCLACALREAGKNIEAQEEFERVLAVEPSYVPAASHYAQWLFEEGRFDRLESLVDAVHTVPVGQLIARYTGAEGAIARLDEMKRAAEALRKAVLLARVNRVHEATISFWPTFRIFANNCPFISTMAYLFSHSSWSGFAQFHFEQRLEQECSHARYADGLLRWHEGKHEQALEACNAAIEGGLDHAIAYCARAAVFQSLNDRKREQEDLLRAHEQQLWLTTARLGLAFHAFEGSDYSRLLELADLSQEDRRCALDYSVSGLLNLAQLERLALDALLEMGALPQALEKVMSDSEPPANHQLHLSRAKVYCANGNIEKAIEEFCVAFELDEGIVSIIARDRSSALKTILKSKTENVAVGLAHALIPAYEGDIEKARSRLRSLSKRFPGNARIWYHIGNTFDILGEGKAALHACRRAVSTDPTSTDAISLLSTLLHKMKDLQGLLALANESEEDIVPLRNALSLARSEEGNESATRIASRILGKYRNDPSAICHILETLDEESVDYTRMMDRLTEETPFDFEERYLIARKYLEEKMTREGAERLEALLRDGDCRLDVVLVYGLAWLATQTHRTPSSGE